MIKKRVKLVSGAFLGFLLLMMPVLASTNECLDNTTLERSMNYTFDTGTQVRNLTITKNIDCEFGCDNVTHACAPNPVVLNAYVGGGVMGLMFVIALIVRMWRRW